jgi:putative flippase GtrA
MSAERTLAAPEQELDDIRKDFIHCLENGDMRSVSALLRIAREQLEARPTSEELIVFILVGCLGIVLVEVVGEVEAKFAIKRYQVVAESVVFLAAYVYSSFWVDRRNRREKRTIRAWARAGLMVALDLPGLVLEPLRADELQLVRSLAGKDPKLKERVQPLLDLGPAPRQPIPDL